MANSLYWEDALSSSGGKQHDMPVDTHNPSFSVQWGRGKYDDVVADHGNLTGERYRILIPCYICGKQGTHHVGTEWICSACQRAQHAEEQRRMHNDQPMGSNKRSTHILTDTTR